MKMNDLAKLENKTSQTCYKKRKSFVKTLHGFVAEAGRISTLAEKGD